MAGEAMDQSGADMYIDSAARSAEVVDLSTTYSPVIAPHDHDEVLTYTTELIMLLRQAGLMASDPDRYAKFLTRQIGFNPFESAGSDG